MITIDYQSKLPLYEQIAKRFQTLILKGALYSEFFSVCDKARNAIFIR